MSENDTSNASQISEPGITPASTEPATGEDKKQSESFRMPNDAPQHLRGKTAEEIVQWSDDVSNQVRQLYQQNQQPQAQPDIQPQPNTALDPDLMLSNPEEYHRKLVEQLNTNNATQMAQAAAPILAAQADTARFMSQKDKYEETWDRWEHEIDASVSAIAPHLRTKALYDQAAKNVRADHVDELVKEKAEALAGAGLGLDTGSTFLGDTDPMYTQTSSDDWAKFDQSSHGKHLMQTLGKRKIAEMCEAHNMTISEYGDMVANSNAVVDPHKGTIENLDLRLGG